MWDKSRRDEKKKNVGNQASAKAKVQDEAFRALIPDSTPVAQNPQKSKSWSWFTANWASVVVAACAFVLSIQQGWENREHNRLMVRPQMSISFNANSAGAGWTHQCNGLGPAIISEFEAFVDGKPVYTWETVLTSLGITPGNTKTQFVVPYPGASWQAVGGSPLLWITDPPAARAALVAGFRRVELRIVYCSVYDECWQVSSNELLAKPTQKRFPTSGFGVPKSWEEGFSHELSRPNQP